MLDVRLIGAGDEGVDVVATEHDEALCFNFPTADEAALFARRLAAVLRTAGPVTVSCSIDEIDVLKPLSAGIQAAEERLVGRY